MANSNRAIIATSLSIIPGAGHIYLHQIFKGFILFLSFVIAIGIIDIIGNKNNLFFSNKP